MKILSVTTKKVMAKALLGVMSFGMLTFATAPTTAATRTSFGTDIKAAAQSIDDISLTQLSSQRYRERRKRESEEHRRERARKDSSDKKYSQGSLNTAAIVGAVIGAVIAKNT